MLEILHGALVFFSSVPRRERPQISALARLPIDLPRIQAVFA
jgi:hypothetical protein